MKGFLVGVLYLLPSITLISVDCFQTNTLPNRYASGVIRKNNDAVENQFTCYETRCWGKKPKNKKKKSPPASSKGAGFGASKSSSSSAVISRGGGEPPSWSKSFPFAGTVRPGFVSPQKTVSLKDGKSQIKISPPDYAKTKIPRASRALLPWMVEVKNDKDIEKMRKAGKLARYVLDLGGRSLRVGMTTNEIDEIVHQATIDAGAYPSPLNYHGFPKSCCTSVNEVICHGIPDDRPLQKGDLINIDITVHLNGYHGDCSEMFVVGYGGPNDDDDYEPDQATKKLLQATYDCWVKSLNIVKPGNFYKDIGGIIEDHVTPLGYSSVRQFCGHGIGQVFHTNPNILHYRNNEPNGQMAPGHTFTIEPMICEGTSKALSWPDNWTATTADGKRSAQFEHTLLITEDGVEALTCKTEESRLQFWEKESKLHEGFWIGTNKSAKERQDEINSQILKNA